MKRLILFCCSCVPFWVQAQTAQVHIAGSNYPVIFADTNLSFAVQKRIAADLTAVFSLAASFKEAQEDGMYGRVEATVSLPGGGTSIITKNGLNYWEGVFKPSLDKTSLSKEDEGFFVVDYNNQKSVRLNNVVSSNYVHAFKLADAHSNAVQKLHGFLTTLKNTDWSAQPIQALRDLRHMTPEDRKNYSDDGYLGFAEEVQQHITPERFTVLGFSLEKRPEVGDKKVLVYGNVLIFYDGRWGFGRFPGM